MNMKSTIRMTKPLINAALTLTALLLLSGCNGHNTKFKANVIVASTDDSIIQTNEAVELVIYQPNKIISNISWQQISGPAVKVLTPNSKVIAFTTHNDGQYQFRASYDVQGQGTQSQDFSFNATANYNVVNARLGHAVVEGNKVSLRAEIANFLNPENIRWSQTAGPSVTFTARSNGERVVYFDAPYVEQDTLLTLEVSLSQNGTNYTDTVSILVEDVVDISSPYFDEPVAKVFPYKADSPYADTLVGCTYSNSLTDSCTFANLPLIAQDTTAPSVADIMNRVVVSHPWMGERFEEFLTDHDDNNDFKNLLRATTAVVISYDIRPSFYSVVSGAIYLDGNNFWLSPNERDTLNEAPDHRSNFGKDLKFVMPWRYILNNDYASDYISNEDRVSRNQDDFLYDLAALLYHELAHANDFLASDEWLIHPSSRSVLAAALHNDAESTQLANTLPLTSNEMHALAQVKFQGNDASATQNSYLPNDVKSFFTADNANDFYNYSSIREDYAMLFEELMMQSRYGISRDTAITNKPSGDNISERDYIVTWGQRGRIGEHDIKPRIAFSASRILPEFDSTTAIANLPTPINMVEGDDWIENLTISPLSQLKQAKASQASNKYITRPVNLHRPALIKLPNE